MRTRNTPRMLAVLSALSAIGIILGKYLAFNITEFMRFSLENIPIIFAGIVFGPIAGMAVGALEDLVGCLLVGYAVNPIITLGSVTVGLVSGLVSRLPLKKAPVIILSVFLSHLLGSVLIKTAGLCLYYFLPFEVTLVWRAFNYSIVGVCEILLLIILLNSKQLLSVISKINPKFPKDLQPGKKENKDNYDI